MAKKKSSTKTVATKTAAKKASHTWASAGGTVKGNEICNTCGSRRRKSDGKWQYFVAGQLVSDTPKCK